MNVHDLYLLQLKIIFKKMLPVCLYVCMCVPSGYAITSDGVSLS